MCITLAELRLRGNGIKLSGQNNNYPVTDADKATSRYTVDGLSKSAPEIPLIVEERP